MTHALVAVLLFAGTSIGLMLWMSRYRRRADWGQAASKQGLGSRSSSMTWMDLLDRDSYRPEGRRFLPWLWLSFFLLVVSIGAAVFEQFWRQVGR